MSKENQASWSIFIASVMLVQFLVYENWPYLPLFKGLEGDRGGVCGIFSLHSTPQDYLHKMSLIGWILHFLRFFVYLLIFLMKFENSERGARIGDFVRFIFFQPMCFVMMSNNFSAQLWYDFQIFLFFIPVYCAFLQIQTTKVTNILAIC